MPENVDDSGPDGAVQQGYTVKRADLEEMSLGVAVPGAVASRTDRNVLELDPLSDVIDVDALDELWGASGSSPRHAVTCVTFHYMGHEVSVTGEELRLVPLASDCGGSEHS